MMRREESVEIGPDKDPNMMQLVFEGRENLDKRVDNRENERLCLSE